MPTPKEIQNLSYLKAKKIDKIIEEIEKRIQNASSSLTKSMLNMFLDQLQTENGRILSKLNQKTISLFNAAYGSYSNTTRIRLLESIMSDIQTIVFENETFYKKSVNAKSSHTDAIRKIVNRRLGIDDKGKTLKNGFLQSLADESVLKSEIQKHIFRELFKGTTPELLRRSLKTVIEGDNERLGLFDKHYRTFSFDVYAQLDAYTGALYADRLGLQYFIYNGGVIKTSRAFCKKKNGKVFSIEEAEKWVDDPTLTAIPSKESYNWLIDRGGYNCRHSIDFIASEVAYVLRPDLKDGGHKSTIKRTLESMS
ncbi:hypothetical protein [Gaetbulibacter sp. PBL-D1]|uniref:hypothetical protein n=1 Tax=Gaetbulibacter sp. PBL-D1 TaxID=3422594 RepID=UPI003D2F2A11